MKVLKCDIHNKISTAKLWEKIWTVVGLESGFDKGKVVLVVRGPVWAEVVWSIF